MDIPAEAVAFSGDGQTLASAVRGVVHRYTTTTGRPVLQQSSSSSGVPLALSRDGNILGKWYSLRDLATGEELRRIDWTEAKRFGTVAFSPDGRHLAIVADGAVMVEDILTGQPNLVQNAPLDAPDLAHLLPDGRTLATVSVAESVVCLWNPRTGEQLRTAPLPGARPLEPLANFGTPWLGELRFVPDRTFAGSKFAYASDNGIHLLDLLTGKMERTLAVPIRGNLSALLLADDGRTLLLRDRPEKVCRVRILDTTTGQMRCELTKPGWDVFPPALSRDGRVACVGDKGGVVHLLDTTTGKLLVTLDHGPRVALATLAFSPDGRRLAVGLYDPSALCLWDVATGRLLHRVGQTEPSHGHSEFRRIIFAADGYSLVTWGSFSTHVWETATLQVRASPNGHRPVLGFAGRALLATRPWIIEDVEVESDVLIHDLGHTTGPPPKDPWVALAEEARPAYHAVRALVATPQRATTLLAEKLRAVPTADARRIRQLIADLDADNFDAREQAGQTLALLGEQAEQELRAAAQSPRSAEQARRLTELVGRFSGTLPFDRLRVLRSIEVLEEIATPEARALLERLAKGAPAALETAHARAALARPGGKP